MTSADTRLEQMRRNPRDWRIDTLTTVAQRHGMKVVQGKGSHVKFSHPSSPTVLTIPARRSVKSVYVKLLVQLIDEITEAP